MPNRLEVAVYTRVHEFEERMTVRDRLKQILAAAGIVLGLSAAIVFLVVRYRRAEALFSGASLSHAVRGPLGEPVNDGCPRRNHSTKKDLTIRFFRELPSSRFDGWIEIRDALAGPTPVLYRGPYSPTITIRAVCYDVTAPGRDKIQMQIKLITEHHQYFFDVGDQLSLRSSSEVAITFWVDFAGVSRASMDLVR